MVRGAASVQDAHNTKAIDMNAVLMALLGLTNHQIAKCNDQITQSPNSMTKSPITKLQMPLSQSHRSG
jgi:hypothetical protein